MIMDCVGPCVYKNNGKEKNIRTQSPCNLGYIESYGISLQSVLAIFIGDKH